MHYDRSSTKQDQPQRLKDTKQRDEVGSVLLYIQDATRHQLLPRDFIPSTEPAYRCLRRQVDQQKNGSRSDCSFTRRGLRQGRYNDPFGKPDWSKSRNCRGRGSGRIQAGEDSGKLGNSGSAPGQRRVGETRQFAPGTRSSENRRYARTSRAGGRGRRKIRDQERHSARVHRLHFAVEFTESRIYAYSDSRGRLAASPGGLQAGAQGPAPGLGRTRWQIGFFG